jgi:hypothetical protein
MSIPDFDNVLLLLPFSEAAGATTLVDRSKYARAVTRGNSATTVNTRSKFYTTSLGVDGSYLRIDSICAPIAGVSAVTFEGWFYRLATTGATAAYFGLHSSAYANKAVFTANSLFGTTGSGTYSSTSAIDAWHHFSAVRTVDRWKAFINGAPVLDVAATANDIISSDLFSIAQEWDSGGVASDFWRGNIQDFCVTLGEKYTGTFTPPGRLIGEISTTAASPILDDANLPAIRKVVAFNRAFPSALVSTTSASDGSFSLTNLPVAEHTVVYLDDDAGTLYNDKVNRVIPA